MIRKIRQFSTKNTTTKEYVENTDFFHFGLSISDDLGRNNLENAQIDEMVDATQAIIHILYVQEVLTHFI